MALRSDGVIYSQLHYRRTAPQGIVCSRVQESKPDEASFRQALFDQTGKPVMFGSSKKVGECPQCPPQIPVSSILALQHLDLGA